MPRPRICRRVKDEPNIAYFVPRGIPFSTLEDVKLKVEEFEVLRLKDLEELEQIVAAEKVGVSQPTFHRILKSARKKVADALVNCKAISIEGGDYVVETERECECYVCSHEWEEPYGTGRPSNCPNCESVNIHRVLGDRGYNRVGGRSRKGDIIE